MSRILLAIIALTFSACRIVSRNNIETGQMFYPNDPVQAIQFAIRLQESDDEHDRILANQNPEPPTMSEQPNGPL